MKKFAALLGVVLFVLGAFVTPAFATAEPNCKTATFTLTDWPDTTSDGGTWAKDKVTRKMTICSVETPAEGVWTYTSTMSDAGSTFVTTGPKSPKAGVSLAAGISGQMSGGMTQTFKAPKDFDGFDEAKTYLETTKFDGVSIRSGSMLSAAYEGVEGFKLVDATYKWTYTTTCETFVDNNGDLSGDITKKCPVQATTPPASPSASASSSASASPSSAASLPVTGSTTPLVLVGVGGTLVLLGALSIIASRLRKTRYEA